MTESGIYKIVNTTNGKYYVGCSSDLRKRWLRHIRELKRGGHANSHLQHSWNKYGESSFVFNIIETVEPKNLLVVEQTYLDVAKLEPLKIYNQSFLSMRVDFTNSVRQKLSAASKGRTSPNKNKKMSDEQKTKIRASLLKQRKTISERMSKSWSFISPKGEKIDIRNLWQFCIKNDLQVSHMHSVHNGSRPHHKGWIRCH